MLDDPDTPFPLISGPPGAGKTTVAWEIYNQMIERKEPVALVDLDLLTMRSPAPADDPYNYRLAASNLAMLWKSYQSAGARRLVAAGIISTPGHLRRYCDAVPACAPVLCRLQANDETLRSRIYRRGRELGSSREHLWQQAVRISANLDANNIADFSILTEHSSTAHIAQDIIARANWPTR
jgi:broad-specificity NMP kinase